MKKIYFDQNIWIDLQKNRKEGGVSLQDFISKKNKIFQVVYSPANIEEICNSYVKTENGYTITDEEKSFLLNLISEVTDNTEIVPYENKFLISARLCRDKGPFIINERPEDCYERVYKKYDSNTFAEASQKVSINISRKVDQEIKRKLGSKNFVELLEKDPIIKVAFLQNLITKLIHITAVDFLIADGVDLHPWTEYTQMRVEHNSQRLRYNLGREFEAYAKKIISKKDEVNILSYGFDVCEAAIDAIMLTMIEAGFRSEKNEVSSLHDNTHAIYAIYCDYFVSRDGPLLKKIKPAYEYFGIKTKLVNGSADIKNGKVWLDCFI